MIRKALLIGCPGDKLDEDNLPGVNVDLNKFYSFLRSYTGGAWEHEEITLLWNPTEKKVLNEVKVNNNVDYSITYFSGHGGYTNEQTYLHFKDNRLLSELNLISKATHQLLIID